MELLLKDLRTAIKQSEFDKPHQKLMAARDIAAGMNFLHSLNPKILVILGCNYFPIFTFFF